MERTAENIKLTTRKLTCIYNKERLPFGCSLFFVIGQGLKNKLDILEHAISKCYQRKLPRLLHKRMCMQLCTACCA